MTVPLRARRDESEPEVVEAFKAEGCSVRYLSGDGVPDLVIGHDGQTSLVEVKTGNAQLRDSQVKWQEGWVGEPVAVVRNAAQARKLVRQWRTASAVERRRLDAHRDDVLSGRTEIV